MERSEMRRHALRHFFREMSPRSRSAVCKASGVAEGAVRDFLSGRNQSLDERTYEKLSDFSGWTVAQIKGDQLRSKVSQKNDTGKNVPNDTSSDIGHNALRTTDSPESEGFMSQLRLEIVDKIWDLPVDKLPGLKKHIEAIERAVAESQVHPSVRETL